MINLVKSKFLSHILQTGGGAGSKAIALDSNTSTKTAANPTPYSSSVSPLGFLFLLPLALTPFAPFYAYMVAVFVMVGFSAYITKEFRILLSLTLVFNIAVIYASKLYFNIAPSYDDDFSRYYQNYLDIYDGIEGAMFVWGNYEIGLSLFYKFLSLILPRLAPQYLLFLTALIVSLLFYVWLEKYGSRFVKKYQRAALIAFVLFLPIIITSLLLTRQYFASIFLLYGFFVFSWWAKIFFFVIAIAFHQSSLLVIPLCYCSYYFPRLVLVVFCSYLLVFIFDSSLVNSLLNETPSVLQNIISSNFLLHLNSNQHKSISLINMDIIRTILILCVIFALFVINVSDKVTQMFKILILICFFVYSTHILPSRIVMLIGDIMFNFILFVVFRHYFRIVLLFLFPYFLRLMWNMFVATDAPETAAIELFFSYPPASYYPFYYFFQGVSL